MNDKKLIAVYIGSFDPFHQGHFEIVKYLESKIVDKVYICPNVPNNSKPLREELYHRYNMIMEYGLYPVIISADDWIRHLKKQGHTLYLVIGTDQYLERKRKGKPSKAKIDNIIVIERNGHVIDMYLKEKFFGKSCTFIQNIKFQDYSSSQIRNELFHNREPKYIDSAINYINNNNLYSRERVLPILIKRYFNILDATLIGDINSLSGDLVYETKAGFVKVYIKNKMADEIRGYHELKQIIGNDIDVIKCVNINKYNIQMCLYSKAKGIRLDTLKCNYFETGRLIGKKLKELHAYKKRNIQRFDDHILDKIEKCHLFDNFVINPGCHTFCHGDLSPTNIFIDEKKQKVTFIDLQNFKTKGYPAYEYHQFVSSITNWISLHEDILTGFVCGYRIRSDIFTKAANKLFQHYWKTKIE